MNTKNNPSTELSQTYISLPVSPHSSVEAMEGEGMGQFSEVKNLICIISFDIRGVHFREEIFSGIGLEYGQFSYQP